MASSDKKILIIIRHDTKLPRKVQLLAINNVKLLGLWQLKNKHTDNTFFKTKKKRGNTFLFNFRLISFQQGKYLKGMKLRLYFSFWNPLSMVLILLSTKSSMPFYHITIRAIHDINNRNRVEYGSTRLSNLLLLLWNVCKIYLMIKRALNSL